MGKGENGDICNSVNNKNQVKKNKSTVWELYTRFLPLPHCPKCGHVVTLRRKGARKAVFSRGPVVSLANRRCESGHLGTVSLILFSGFRGERTRGQVKGRLVPVACSSEERAGNGFGLEWRWTGCVRRKLGL